MVEKVDEGPAPQEPGAPKERTSPRTPPETAEHPAPGIHHEPEPDAENIMPAEDEPGTF